MKSGNSIDECKHTVKKLFLQMCVLTIRQVTQVEVYPTCIRQVVVQVWAVAPVVFIQILYFVSLHPEKCYMIFSYGRDCILQNRLPSQTFMISFLSRL